MKFNITLVSLLHTAVCECVQANISGVKSNYYTLLKVHMLTAWIISSRLIRD